MHKSESGDKLTDHCDFLLVDDHPLLQLGLAAELRALGHTVALALTSGRAALLDQIAQLQPSVVVLDHGLPELGNGLELVAPILDLGSTVVMLTGTLDEVMWGDCLTAGASGVISKAEPFQEILDSLAAVLEQRPIRQVAASKWKAAALEANAQRSLDLAPFDRLSARERIVLMSLIEGASPAAIAETEFVALATVRSQIKSILRKLEVGSQLEAVAQARRAAWPAST